MELVVYAYDKCKTCRLAIKLLDQYELSYLLIPIDRQLPQKNELEKLLAYNDNQVSCLFNFESEEFHKRNLAKLLSALTRDQALEQLQSSWKLFNCPLLIGPGMGLVGFKEEVWRTKLGGIAVR